MVLAQDRTSNDDEAVVSILGLVSDFLIFGLRLWTFGPGHTLDTVLVGEKSGKMETIDLLLMKLGLYLAMISNMN